tara:strand:+ start:547 stop:948 length:402 start_codon:yes stop_codon:yes gene_type:complete
MSQALKKLELEFTKIEFYDNYLISTIQEDQKVDASMVDDLIKIAVDFYGDKKFVYISKRENLYNVDPSIYVSKLKKFDRLIGIAVVSTMLPSINSAKFERNFATNFPYEIFLNMDEATKWADELITEQRIKNT